MPNDTIIDCLECENIEICRTATPLADSRRQMGLVDAERPRQRAKNLTLSKVIEMVRESLNA